MNLFKAGSVLLTIYKLINNAIKYKLFMANNTIQESLKKAKYYI